MSAAGDRVLVVVGGYDIVDDVTIRMHRRAGVRPGRQVEQYPKSSFPTDRVYANTSSSELRLITCGGEFDRRARSYRDNLVAYARLVATERS